MQQSGLPRTDYYSYNTRFWRFEANIFHGNMTRLNHILKGLASCKEDHAILDMKCALIHSEIKWTAVTRPNWQKKDQRQPVNLKALPLEKKIQPMLPPPLKINSGMNNEKIQSAKERNKCRIILDSVASINIFYNKNIIENVQYIDNPHEVTTGVCMKMEYNQVGMLTSLLRHLPLLIDGYYYHDDVVANLVSIGKIYEEFRIVFDSGIHDAFYMFNDDGTYIVFNKTRNKLYCLSVFNGDEHDCCYIPLWLEFR